MAEKLVPPIAEEAIAATVSRLAQELDRDDQNRSPLLVGILKGSFIFLGDLVRNMKTPIRSIEFIRVSSYGSFTLCALLDKPARRQVPVTIDYLGLTVSDRFVVGYGIDFD
ncbi:MAG TPA: hypothetical protein DCY88_28140 [Cyanobacteria bacterium UBA11372]|nr:hypothetical protein [Cyanobacteria bacterium UBA11372]